jgi:hypothetical protein
MLKVIAGGGFEPPTFGVMSYPTYRALRNPAALMASLGNSGSFGTAQWERIGSAVRNGHSRSGTNVAQPNDTPFAVPISGERRLFARYFCWMY